jgi:signal transduction histidine kinase
MTDQLGTVGNAVRLPPDLWRPGPRRWLGPRAAVASGCALAVAAQWPLLPNRPALAVVNGLVGVLFLTTGALLGAEEDQRGNGRLFVLAGVAWAGVGLENWRSPSLELVGWLCGPIFAVVAATVLLRYPESRLPHRHQRVFIAIAFGWVELAAVAIAATKGGRTGALVETAGTAGVALLALIFVGMLGVRLARARGLQRRTLTPVVVAAIAAGVAIGVRRLAIVLSDASMSTLPLLLIEMLALIAIPGGFLAAALQRRLARAAVADLVLSLTRPGGGGDVLTALRDALHDPNLQILYWVDDEACYLRDDGTPGDFPGSAANCLTTPILTSGGDRLALVRMDATLTRHAPIVNAALSAAGLMLENARLQAGIRAQLAEARASRARIVEAGLAERRRLEQNLHDGAQQRLLALSIQLAKLRAAAPGPAAGLLIDEASANLRGATRELRELAHGLHPAVLDQAGLGAALESVAERLPLPVILAIPASRWTGATELAAYFVACEALTNAVKHARATRVSVTVAEQDGSLRLEVTDDGVGGATRPGHGLTGIRDRVAAAGGTWNLTSRAGAGTPIPVTLPLRR